MGVATHTCFTLICDECGKPIESVEYEGATSVPHYGSPEGARASLVGDPDEDGDSNAFLDGQHINGADVCGACNVVRVCIERGHDWRAWSPCYCRGIDNERPPCMGHEDGCPESRWCDRIHCHAHESRPQMTATS